MSDKLVEAQKVRRAMGERRGARSRTRARADDASTTTQAAPWGRSRTIHLARRFSRARRRRFASTRARARGGTTA